MTKKISILDVAAAAGVSRGAVTRALNNKVDINPETKKRVLEVAAQLGYRPSRFAQNFAARDKSRSLGYAVGSFRNPYYTDMAGDMVAQAARKRWQVTMVALEGPDDRDDTKLLDMLNGQVDVAVGHFNGTAKQLKAVARGLPIVLLEQRSDVPGVHSVEVDLRNGIIESVSALRARGAKCIGMIESNYARSNGRYSPSPRRAYFEDIFAGAPGLPIVVGEESFAGGAEAFTRLLSEHPSVDAVIVFNDVVAIGAIHGAHVAGIDVPRRVRILGIDGLNMGEAVSPTLSSLSVDRWDIVMQALEIVEELAANMFAEMPPIRRMVRPKLLWRESAWCNAIGRLAF